MRELDLAWFAGLFEGEGCFSIDRNGCTRLTVAMTDEDVIDRIKTLFPICQNVAPFQPQPARAGYSVPKIRFTWRVSDPHEVERITGLILPFLGRRRSERAQEVLRHLATRPGTGSFQRNKTHCVNGHAFSEANTVLGRDGHSTYRRCRTCLDAANRRYRERRKSA